MSGSLNVGKIIAKILGTYKPPVKPPDQPPPPVIVPPTDVPFDMEKFIQEKVHDVVAMYFVAGDRWEKQTGIGNLYRKTSTYTNTIRFGGWDCRASENANINEVIECLNRTISTIKNEYNNSKNWIISLDLELLGQDSYTIIKRQLECFRQVWDKVLWIEVADEPNESIKKYINLIKDAFKELNLEPRPLSATFYRDQILNQSIWREVDIVSIEAYSRKERFPGDGKRSDLIAEMRSDLNDQMQLLLDKPVVIVPQAYSRNYAWTNLPNNEALLFEGFKFARERKSAPYNIVGVCSFSFARPSGSSEYPTMIEQLKRGYNYFLTGTDTGPDAQSEVEIKPVPKVLDFERNSMGVLENQSYAQVKVIRYGEPDKKVSTDYYTEDLHNNPLDYAVTIGTLVFAWGEIEKIITVPIFNDRKPLGHREFFVKLRNPVGIPYVEETPHCRVTLLDTSNSVEFITLGGIKVYTGMGTEPQPIGFSTLVMRAGDTSKEVKVHVVSEKIDADNFKPVNEWVTIPAGKSDARITYYVNTLSKEIRQSENKTRSFKLKIAEIVSSTHVLGPNSEIVITVW